MLTSNYIPNFVAAIYSLPPNSICVCLLCFFTKYPKDQSRKKGATHRGDHILHHLQNSKEKETKTMAYNHSLPFFFFFLLMSLASSSTTFLYNDIFESHGPIARSLLQAKKSCPVNFESQNYTIITSQCKGPQFPPKHCCEALKEFACPFADSINDLQSDCSTTMFSYINLYGKYPPGLFASQCREGKEGLDCTEVLKAKENMKNSAHIAASISSKFLILPIAFSMFLFQFF